MRGIDISIYGGLMTVVLNAVSAVNISGGSTVNSITSSNTILSSFLSGFLITFAAFKIYDIFGGLIFDVGRSSNLSRRRSNYTPSAPSVEETKSNKETKIPKVPTKNDL